MLSFFQKKTYLVDLIEGTTDFHNHVLPGIDDGAKDIEDSKKLIQGFKEIGINSLVATPHIIGDYYPNNKSTINTALRELTNEKAVDINISAAAEYMMDQYFLDLLKNGEILPVTANNLLVEMSYLQQPINLHEILFEIQSQSFSPILAHPERYPYLHGKSLGKYEELKMRGCSFQINMLSLIGHYGNHIQKTAYQLLENDMVDYLGSDVHRIDHLDKIKQIKIQKKAIPAIKKTVENNLKLFSV